MPRILKCKCETNAEAPTVGGFQLRKHTQIGDYAWRSIAHSLGTLGGSRQNNVSSNAEGVTRAPCNFRCAEAIENRRMYVNIIN